MSENKKVVMGYSQADFTAEEDEHELSEILIHVVSYHWLWRGQNPTISGDRQKLLLDSGSCQGWGGW